MNREPEMNEETGAPGSRALERLRVVELGGIGPALLAGMMLADLGAEVIRVDRLDSDYSDLLLRGKRSIRLNVAADKAARSHCGLSRPPTC